MSNGMFSVQGVVVGWILLDSNDTWYEGPSNGLSSAGHVAQLISEAVLKSDTLDFGQFDNDGPDGQSNSGDDDGYVDVAVFVHPERDGACGPGSNRNIWSHRFFYNAWTGGVPLSTNDATHSSSAGFATTRVNSYTIQSGVGGSNACDQNSIMAVGTTAHEMGHGLGLPDFYDTNFGDVDASEGIGHWGLMGSGNYASPRSPAHMEGFSRLQLGWVTLLDLAASGTYALRPYTEADTIYRYLPPAPNARGEYFLLENRQLTGSDSGLADGTLGQPKGPGLLIWHIDPQKYNTGLFSNAINTGAIHAVALMQADGLGNLRSSTSGVRNRGDAGDPFPGTSLNTVFGLNSNPSVRLNDNVVPPFVIDSIRQVVPQGEMAFRFRTGPLSLVSAADTAARVRVRGSSFSEYRDLFSDGDTVSVAIDSLQYSPPPDQRMRFVFLSWSDGGARSHVATMTAGGNLTANVSRSNLLRFTALGSGTISTAPTRASGDYLAPTDTVTLTATPVGNSMFAGWIGDTTTSNAVVKLAMDRSYVVYANFVTALAVVDTALQPGVMGYPYLDTLRMTGGNGSFLFQAIPGVLPEGLQLAPGGYLAGIPSRSGTYDFVVHVTSGTQALDLPLRMVVTQPALVAYKVINQLTRGGTYLTTAERTYLDLLGNRNGGYDLGDLVAWLDETGTAVSAEEMARILAARRP